MPPLVRAPAHHERVAAYYRRRIRSGRLRPGAALPSVRDIAELWAVSTRTGWRAIGLLRDEGLIECRQGARAVVVKELPRPAARRARTPERRPRSFTVGAHDVPGASGAERSWLAAHRHEVLALAEETLRYRDLGGPDAEAGLAEVERDVAERRVTPSSFLALQMAMLDLGSSRGVREAADDHPVHTVVDRWVVLLAQHPAQRP